MMSSENSKVKLGKRLEHIKSMVTAQYDHIWDCCCDHGLLGAALLSQQIAQHIHFVDVVPELMQQLENKLTRFFPKNKESRARWQVHCADVATLQVKRFSGKQLVIIAGVGGNLMSEFVAAIWKANPAADIEFLLCPTLHQYTLRQQLIALDFRLKSETLITENNRFYEILAVVPRQNLVTPCEDTTTEISAAGREIWHSENNAQAKVTAAYLRKTLAHYRRVQLDDCSDVQAIIDAYCAVTSQSFKKSPGDPGQKSS